MESEAGAPAGVGHSRKWGSWDELKVDAWQVVHGTRLPHQAPLSAGVSKIEIEPSEAIGEAYRPADESAQINAPMEISVDPGAYERALSSHGRLGNGCAGERGGSCTSRLQDASTNF